MGVLWASVGLRRLGRGLRVPIMEVRDPSFRKQWYLACNCKERE